MRNLGPTECCEAEFFFVGGVIRRAARHSLSFQLKGLKDVWLVVYIHAVDEHPPVVVDYICRTIVAELALRILHIES